jgi:hypothetical protein
MFGWDTDFADQAGQTGGWQKLGLADLFGRLARRLGLAGRPPVINFAFQSENRPPRVVVPLNQPANHLVGLAV